ncbi:hypothetical protein BN1708_011481 [Verticillium longisporum]|uniref:Intradiol ring-cleavage dioxygenases domain-containing protein n=1 Tax=Verticillium longisporum TaxID=100787 RepID=A0A0G4L163_VERLO|nr:hypothetical protein BN1708_011481 [Verticillium longisporum]
MAPSIRIMGARLLTLFLGAFLLASIVSAHGAHEAEELAELEKYSLTHATSLAHCRDTLQRDGVLARAIERRAAVVETHMRRRDIISVLRKDHENNTVNWKSTDREIFATRDDGCVLTPESTEGPFYIEGEKLRWNLQDGGQGVLMYLDFQIIDTETCKPVEGQYVEIWRSQVLKFTLANVPSDTNATGIYSGVPYSFDPSNRKTTFGRGISTTNSDGAVWFGSIFPGHYGGRTPHVHIMTHNPDYADPLTNRTLQNNIATHAGQVYFDQRLVDAVRNVYPYSANEQRFTSNFADGFFRQASSVSDPVLSYFFLNKAEEGYGNVEGGLLAWKIIGVNMTREREISVMDTLHAGKK